STAIIDPAPNFAASFAARQIDVAVDPLCTETAAPACAPSAATAAPFAGASTFICCEPVASAIVSFVQLRNSKLRRASRVSRTCSKVLAGIPVNTGLDLLRDWRLKPWIHPRSIQGGGGESRINPPCAAGSKTTGV